ncbi:BMP-binding endothelial regulator protein-like [Photinus pyralis]|uniref:BMP-binding endothelial regulator protein-like n=1 Tax=Photinus pyralis TaxID=7054 RepID=UPI0012676F66|nr:BMP-binding endothelial regulator protein-like [Photinus pyralis]
MDLRLAISSAAIILCFICSPQEADGHNTLSHAKRSRSVREINELDYEDYETESEEKPAVAPHPGMCFMWSDSHVKTFDGEIFSFKSPCAFTLISDNVDNTFSINVEEAAECAEGPDHCYKVIKIYLQNREYILSRTYDGLPVLTNNGKSLPIPSRLPGLITDISAHYIIASIDVLGLRLRWDTQSFIQVDVGERLWNKTSGLCGLYDGDEYNDLIGRNGLFFKNIATLVKSWQADPVGVTCEDQPEQEDLCTRATLKSSAQNFCTQILNDKRFEACRKTVAKNSHIATALVDRQFMKK